MTQKPLPAQRIEEVIRAYIKACNDADAAGIAACFHLDAVHYFPHMAKWSGASTIGAILPVGSTNADFTGLSIK